MTKMFQIKVLKQNIIIKPNKYS